MTRDQQHNLYDIVAEAYKRHGSALVEGPYAKVDTCTIKAYDNGTIVVSINSEVPFVETWFALIGEVKDAFVEEGYEIVKTGFFYDFYDITLRVG